MECGERCAVSAHHMLAFSNRSTKDDKLTLLNWYCRTSSYLNYADTSYAASLLRLSAAAALHHPTTPAALGCWRQLQRHWQLLTGFLLHLNVSVANTTASAVTMIQTICSHPCCNLLPRRLNTFKELCGTSQKKQQARRQQYKLLSNHVL